MSNGSLGYYMVCDKEAYPGPYAKAQGIVAAASALGYRSCLWAAPEKGLRGYLRLAAAVSGANEDIVFVRGVSYAYPLIALAMLIARLRGRRLYLDVPSPQCVALREILHSTETLAAKVTKTALITVTGPLAFWPATVVIEYAPEGGYFRLGNAGKIIQLGNGIDLEAVQVRDSEPSWPTRVLTIVGVGRIENWQGYDRIIRAIAHYQRQLCGELEICFKVIGVGSATAALQVLSEQLGLSGNVLFLGQLTGKRLRDEYESAHIAVDTLALHRKGLSVASSLKAREYCAVGIPFLSACDDPDFAADEEFRFSVSNNDDYKEIAHLFTKLSSRVLPNRLQIRAIAEERLSWVSKLNAVGIAGAAGRG